MSNPSSFPISPADNDELSTMASQLDMSSDTVKAAQRAAITELSVLEKNPQIRPMSPQPASRLLSLSSEIRLLICHHMYISPELGVDFLGAFYSCSQLQKDMLDELSPAFDLKNYVNEHAGPCRDEPSMFVRVVPSTPRFHILRHVTVSVRVPRTDGGSRCCYNSVAGLFPLYLNKLSVRLFPRNHAGDYDEELVYGDMKSWPNRFFLDYVVDGEVNCKKIKFSLPGLKKNSDGSEKTTRLENIIIPGTTILYSMHITEDKAGNQTERTYLSDVRFRPTAEGSGGAVAMR